MEGWLMDSWSYFPSSEELCCGSATLLKPTSIAGHIDKFFNTYFANRIYTKVSKLFSKLFKNGVSEMVILMTPYILNMH